MGYDDWTHEPNGGSITLDSGEFSEGNASLAFSGEGGQYSILDQAITDSPDEGRVISQAKLKQECSIAFQGRFVDADNRYILRINGYTNSLASYKIVNGNTTTFQNEILSGTEFQHYTLSDGSGPKNRFVPYKFDIWVDSAGDVRTRISEDADADGTWTQIGSDGVDSSPSITGGGGLGISIMQTNPGNFDETEVYY